MFFSVVGLRTLFLIRLVSDDMVRGSTRFPDLHVKASGVCLGIVRLDEYPLFEEGGQYKPAPGDVDYPFSFPYPVEHTVAKHCTFGNLCNPEKWKTDQELRSQMEAGLRAAIEELDQLGCTMITSDCGIFAWMQQFGQSCTNKPVVLSSLVYLPSLFHVVNPKRKIAIFTSNAESMRKLCQSAWLQGMIEGQGDRLVMVGCNEDTYGHLTGFEAVAEGTTVNVPEVRKGMIVVAKHVIEKDPEIGAILVECTEIPPYSDAIRHATMLPVYDIITVCNTFMAGWIFPPFTEGGAPSSSL